MFDELVEGMETAGGDRRRLYRLLLPSGGSAAALAAGGKRPLGGALPGEMVRPGACAALSGAGLFHCRGGRRLRQPGGGHEVSGAEGEQDARLWGSLRLRDDPRRLLLHHPAAFRRHLPHGRGAGAGLRLSLFRPGDQYPRHRPDRSGARPGDGDRPGRRRHQFCGDHRPPHASLLPPGGAGQGRGGRRPAGAGGEPSAVADGALFRQHGRHPGLCQLGQTGRAGRPVAGDLRRQVADHRLLRPGPGLDAGGLVPGRSSGRCWSRRRRRSFWPLPSRSIRHFPSSPGPSASPP